MCQKKRKKLAIVATSFCDSILTKFSYHGSQMQEHHASGLTKKRGHIQRRKKKVEERENDENRKENK